MATGTRRGGFLRTLFDHPLRHIVQNSLLYLPGTYRLQQARYTTGAMNRPDLMAAWSRQVIQTAQSCGIDVADSRLAEVGPGHSLGIAVCLLLAGAADVMAVDVRAFADPSDVEAFRPILEHLRRIGALDEGHPELHEIAGRLTYRIVSNDGHWPIPDGSRDVVYSFFSGEHLRSPDKVLAETHRVLRPGGLCLHAINLCDHLCHPDGNWLKFLSYGPRLWEAMTSKRGHWCNRLRAPEWRDLFSRRFDLVAFDESRDQPIPVDFDRGRLARKFRDFDDQTLSITGLWVVAKKVDGS